MDFKCFLLKSKPLILVSLDYRHNQNAGQDAGTDALIFFYYSLL